MKKDMKLVIYIIVLVLVLIFGVKNITAKGNFNIRKIKNEIVELKDNKVDIKNDGKLVIVKGKLNTKDNELKDNDFIVSLKDTVKLTRNVEIYRYHKERNKVKTGWESTLDEYEKILHDKKTDVYYTNPVNVINSQTVLQDAYIGDFTVNKELFKELDNNKKYTDLTEEVANKLQYLTKLNNKFYVNKNYYTTVKDNKPLISDFRVSFDYLDVNELKDVTIIAKQTSDKLEPYSIDGEKEIFEIYQGNISKKEIIKKLEGTSIFVKIVSIVLIIVVLILGYYLFIKPNKKTIKKENKRKTR